MHTDTTPTPILDNVRAVLADHGTFDGKRGNTWTPNGPTHYTDARRTHRSTEPQSIEIICAGTVERNGSELYYSPGLVIHVARWYHLYNTPGSFVTVRPPYEALPDGARMLIAAEVLDRFEAVRYALGYGATEHDAGAFLDAMFTEASRQALAHQISRKRDDMERLAAEVADLEAAAAEGGDWTGYPQR